MKRKSEIRNMLHDYKNKLESTKTDIANIAMDGEIGLDEKNKKLTKIEPIYQAYQMVIDVLEDILEVSLESKVQELEDESDEEVMV